MRLSKVRKLATILTLSMVTSILPANIADAAAYQSVSDSRVIARLNFDNESDGFKGGNAVATNYGVTLSEDAVSGKAAYFSGNSYLSLKATNGGSLLAGKSAITVNYFRKCGASGVGWTFYAAPNEKVQTFKTEHYVGVMDVKSSVTVERFNNTGSRGDSLIVKGSYDGWQMVTIVMEATSSKVFVNGNYQGSLGNQFRLTDILGNNGILYLGKANWKSGEYFNGLMDDFAIFDGALSDNEIKSIYQEEMAKLEQGKEQKKTQMLRLDFDALSIPNQYNIKGNITLPTVGKYGSAISWESSNPSVISDKDSWKNGYTVPAGVVNRQSTDTKMKLTATITANGESRKKEFVVRVRAKKSQEKTTDYLFAYFTGNTVAGENIYFATSQNGLNFLEVNDKNPVLTSLLGEKGLRDPYIFRSYEGDKYYILATDLSIGRNGNWTRAGQAGSQAIMIWESDDLIHWSEQRMVTLSDKINAGNTWAPEAYYDETTGEYIVFWASLTSNDNFGIHRIYYSKTRDFVNFTDPKPWIDRKTANTIDTTVVAGNDGYLYRISKNEGNGTLPDGTKVTGATVYMEKSKTMLGNWTRVYAPTLEKIARVEGPCIYRLNDDDAWTPTWCTLLDHYGNGGYRAYLTNDLVANKNEAVFKAATNASLPKVPRHGTVMQLTSSEYQKVMDYFQYHKNVPEDSSNYVPEGYDDSHNSFEEESKAAESTAEESKVSESIEAPAPTEQEKTAGFVLAYTTTNESAALGNSLHLALSEDGYHYAALNSNSGICFANNKGGKKNVNPNSLGSLALFRKADGTYGLLAKNATTKGKYIYVFDSKNLVNFSGERKLSVNAEVTDIYGCVYSENTHSYEIYYKSGNTVYVTTTTDLANASSTTVFYGDVSKLRGQVNGISMPEGAVAGNVLSVNAEEYAALLNKLGVVKNTSLQEVSVTAYDKASLELPNKVTATYSDGSTALVGVSWDLSRVDMSKKGTYEVKGTLKQTKYANPLIPQRADPCILKGADGYYYFTASYPMLGSSDKNGYDKIVLRRAKTIEGLSNASEVTIFDCDNVSGENRYVWAPEIHCINGTYYIFYTSSIQSNNVWGIRPHVLKCNNASNIMNASAWETKGVMQAASGDSTSFTNFSLDMTLFENNGRYYVMWAQTDGFSSIYIAEVDKNAPWKCISKATKISVPEYSWERVVENVDEGPNVLKHDGKLYCTFSAAGTGVEYCIGLLTADANADLLNASSWVKQGYPILTSKDVPGEYGPGHNSFTVDEAGNVVFVYHARGQQCYNDRCAWASQNSLYDPCRDARVKRVHFAKDGSPILKMTYEEELATTSITAKVIIQNDLAVSESEEQKESGEKKIVSGDGWYYIKNVNADKYLTVENNSAKAGANVCIYEKNGTDGQKWKVTTLSDGAITLTSALGDFMIDIAYGKDEDGANIGIYNGYGGEAQQYILKKVEGKEAYFIGTKVSNGTKVIDVNGKGKKNGTNVLQWTLNQQTNQQFVFESVDGDTSKQPQMEVWESQATKPNEETKESQAVKPSEETKESQAVKPSEETKESQVVKPSEETKESQAVKPSEETKESQAVKPSEETKESKNVTPTKAENTQPAEGLKVNYTINSWGSGYQVSFKISNTGNAVNSWTLRVKRSDMNISSSWNVSVKIVGDEYVITPVSWNSFIGKGGNVEFGIIGSGSIGKTISCSIK